MQDIIISILLVIGFVGSAIILGKEFLKVYQNHKKLGGYPSLYDVTENPEDLAGVLGYDYIEWMKSIPVKPGPNL